MAACNMPDAATIKAGSSLSSTIRRGATLGLARVSGIGAQMAVQIVVGALAGPSGIGALQLHMAWSSVVGEVLGRGEATRAMRETAVIAHDHAGEPIRRNLRRAFGHIAGFSAVLAAIAVLLLATGLGAAVGVDNAVLAVSVIAAAPLFAFTRVLAETLKALDKPLIAVSVENTSIPLAVLGACAALAFLLPQPLPLSLAGAGEHAIVNALLIAAVLGACAATLLLLRSVHRATASNPRASSAGRTHALGKREQLHFWLTGLLNIAFLQLPFLVMPWLVSTDDVGEFAVAHKLVNVITTLLILLAAVYAPRFARAAAAARGDEVRRLLRETQYLSLALFTPVWIVLLLLAEPLSGLFSLGDSELLPLLLILGAGQFINAGTGLSGVMLNMSGAPHLETGILSVCMFITLVAAVWLGSAWGAMGIAAASAGGIALRNLASYAMASRHLKRLESSAP